MRSNASSLESSANSHGLFLQPSITDVFIIRSIFLMPDRLNMPSTVFPTGGRRLNGPLLSQKQG